MLKGCLEVFNNELKAKGDNLILDSYVPADGTYLIAEPVDDSFKIMHVIEIKQDKKTKEIDRSDEHFKEICQLDYNSRLIDMNKPIDGKKIIHSNNYLSFFIKKDSLTNGKLTNEVIDNYYAVLANPYVKYDSKPKAKKLYAAVEEELGQVNLEALENIKKWIKENIFNLNVDIKGKDYLKIFFKASIEDYKREGKRYLIPNIYNSNDFNVSIKNNILGVPNNNMGMNSKKPYLENKTRKSAVPYLINNEEVLEQKGFFDYLMNQACMGKVNIYIDDKIHSYKNGDLPDRDFSGAFLRIKKGKEVEIHDYDYISKYRCKLPKAFNYKNILGLDLSNKNISTKDYGEKNNYKQVQNIIDDVFFSKFLINNYFTEAGDLSINDACLKKNLLLARESLFNWFYKGIQLGVFPILNKISLDLVKGSLDEGFLVKASHQFNLRWSLIEYFKGGMDMADVIHGMKSSLREKINCNETMKIDNDDEYYFSVGQLVSYLISKSKGKKKPHSLANPFINVKDNEVIKEKLRRLFGKYSYDPDINGRRFNNLYAMVIGYVPEGKVNQDLILAGYLNSNLIYESNKEEN